jgi:hypothetical protein
MNRRYFLASLVVLLAGTAAAAAADAPPTRVVVEMHRKWEPIVLPSLDLPTADCVGMDLYAEHATFVTASAGIGLFEYPLHVPIPVERYPVLVLKYRARELDAARDKPGLFLDDVGDVQRFRALREAVKLTEFVADGNVNELRKDLRGLVTPGSAVTRLMLGLVAAEGKRGTLEVIELAFESAADAPPPAAAEAQAPITVEVVGRDGQPVAGATVTVDAERKEFARTAKTDASGRATVEPVPTEGGTHAVQVEAEGTVPLEYTIGQGDAPAESPLRVETVRARRAGQADRERDGARVRPPGPQHPAAPVERAARPPVRPTHQRRRPMAGPPAPGRGDGHDQARPPRVRLRQGVQRHPPAAGRAVEGGDGRAGAEEAVVACGRDEISADPRATSPAASSASPPSPRSRSSPAAPRGA